MLWKEFQKVLSHPFPFTGSSYDLTVYDLKLLPEDKVWVETNRDEILMNMFYEFTIEVRSRPGNIPYNVPPTLNYQFVMAPAPSPERRALAQDLLVHSVDTPSIDSNVFTWSGK